MSTNSPVVTVCIRTFNEGSCIKECLEQVLWQRCTITPDVLVIDSGSTDNTVTTARQFPVRLHEITKEAFHYAETLNLGVQLSCSDLFVPLSAHAIPADENWLQPLIDTVWQNPTTAGAYSRQMTRGKIDPYEEALARAYFPARSQLRNSNRSIQGIGSFSVVFTNTSACIRTQLLRETPFRRIPRCEDRLWATEISRRGYSIAYVPESCVYHTHNYLPSDYYKMGTLDGAAKELVDGPVRSPIITLGRVVSCSLLARLIDSVVRGLKGRREPGLAYRVAARWGNSFALRLGQVEGVREGKETAGRLFSS